MLKSPSFPLGKNDLLEIFKFLAFYHLIPLSRVNKQWYQVVYHPSLWKDLKIDHMMYYYKAIGFQEFLERLQLIGVDCSGKMTESKFYKYISQLQEWNVKLKNLTENKNL